MASMTSCLANSPVPADTDFLWCYPCSPVKRIVTPLSSVEQDLNFLTLNACVTSSKFAACPLLSSLYFRDRWGGVVEIMCVCVWQRPLGGHITIPRGLGTNGHGYPDGLQLDSVKPKYLGKTRPNAILSTRNSTLSNLAPCPGLRDGQLETSHLNSQMLTF